MNKIFGFFIIVGLLAIPGFSLGTCSSGFKLGTSDSDLTICCHRDVNSYTMFDGGGSYDVFIPTNTLSEFESFVDAVPSLSGITRKQDCMLSSFYVFPNAQEDCFGICGARDYLKNWDPKTPGATYPGEAKLNCCGCDHS